MTAFSICVTGRNTLPFFKECLDSVLAQTFTDYECLICDDASDDGSADAIAEWVAQSGGSRFRLIANTTRHYVPSTVKHLIERASGDVIIKLDGDDLFSGPHVLDRIRRAYSSHPNVDATHGSFRTFPKATPWPLSQLPAGYPWYEGWCVSHVLTWRRSLSLASFAEEWHSAAYESAPGVPYRTAGDVSLFMPIFFRARTIAFIPDVLLLYRRHQGNDDLIDRQAQLGAEQRICAYWKRRVFDRARAVKEPTHV